MAVPTLEERVELLEAKTSLLQLACGLALGSALGLGLAERLLTERDQDSGRSDDRANPELPVSEPVHLDASGDTSRARHKLQDVIAAPVNDQHVPPALLSGSKDPHRGDRTPK